tara:strand:+ start:138 stop:392 length:255 start_codon:yes stop_codon:yes gene_type:complete
MNINEEANSEVKEDSEQEINSEVKIEDENAIDRESSTPNDDYKLGWNKYSELTNGRFAMIGFIAILLIELISQESFLKWANLLN